MNATRTAPVVRSDDRLLLIPPVAFATLAASLLCARIFLTGSLGFTFLMKNLFLAWVPLIAAIGMTYAHRRGGSRAGLWVMGIIWLLFLPNAPYILTDMVHLSDDVTPKYWYRLGLILAFALAGLLAGVVSMRLVQDVLTERAGSVMGWAVVLISGGLCGVGIFVGRVLRWNSWDVLTRPTELVATTLNALLNPMSHRHAFAFSVVFGMLVVVAYVSLNAMSWSKRSVRTARSNRD